MYLRCTDLLLHLLEYDNTDRQHKAEPCYLNVYKIQTEAGQVRCLGVMAGLFAISSEVQMRYQQVEEDESCCPVPALSTV
jgi:hypothetical protein